MKARFGQNCGTLLNGRQGQGALTVCSMVPEGKLTSSNGRRWRSVLPTPRCAIQ
jgi:hypothetical protein